MQELNAIKPISPLAKYQNPEDLQVAITGYFDTIDATFKEIDKQPCYTVSGLARAIGLDRKALIEYAKRDAYSYTLKDAKRRIEEHIETRLMTGQPIGPIFNLKNNYGWRDEKQVTVDTTVRLSVNLTGLPLENTYHDNNVLEHDDSIEE